MKTPVATLLTLLLLVLPAHAWVNNVVFITGKVVSVDKEKIVLLDAKNNTLYVPKSALMKGYVLHTAAGSKPIHIPVQTQYVTQMTWKAAKPDPTFAVAYERMRNVQRKIASLAEKTNKK